MAIPIAIAVGISPELEQKILEKISAIYKGELPLVAIVPVTYMEFGMDEKMIEKYEGKVLIVSTKPRASLSERFFNRIKLGVAQFYPSANSAGPYMPVEKAAADMAAGDWRLLDRIYGPPGRAPNLNYAPADALTVEEMVSVYKKQNAQHLFNFAEACLVGVGMEKEAKDFRECVKAKAESENFESVKLWNYFTLTYKMHRELVAAGLIEVPAIVDKLPPPNPIFPTPRSGWKPKLKDKASKAVIIKEGCGEKRKVAVDADADDVAGPSLLKKNKVVL